MTVVHNHSDLSHIMKAALLSLRAGAGNVNTSTRRALYRRGLVDYANGGAVLTEDGARQADLIAEQAGATLDAELTAPTSEDTVTVTVPRALAEATVEAWNLAMSTATAQDKVTRFRLLAEAYEQLRAAGPYVSWLDRTLTAAARQAESRAEAWSTLARPVKG